MSFLLIKSCFVVRSKNQIINAEKKVDDLSALTLIKSYGILLR